MSREHEYQALIDAIDQGFCICEVLVDADNRPRDYRFLEVNRLFEAHTGLHAAAGRTALELLPDLERRWIEVYGDVALTGKPARFEMGSDVMGRWFDVHSFPIGPREERKIGILFTDITRQKEAAEAVANASRMKDEFLATVSHELRSPVQAVLGWVHMLRTGSLGPEATERALATLERNASAQKQLVDDLLDRSRITSGKLRIEKEPVELAAIITGAVETLTPSAGEKDITLQVNLEPHAAEGLQGDANRLRQIVVNLLSNAVKFTPDGGRVEVALARRGRHAEIRVCDNGRGIEPALLPVIFDRFRQGDAAATGQEQGLGLGLSLVRHLVEAHGGAVTAESDGPGRGATFTVRLPLVEEVLDR